MNQLARALQRFLDKRLASLTERPEIWGSQESVELQVLQLLEVRALVINATCDEDSLRQIQDHYIAFLSERFPDTPPVTLAERLATTEDSEQFTEYLQAFVQQIIARQGTRPGGEKHLGTRRAAGPPARRGLHHFLKSPA